MDTLIRQKCSFLRSRKIRTFRTMADTSTRPVRCRLEVCVELALAAADDEAVRWAVERAVERAAADAGAEVLRVTVTADPL